MTPYVFRDSKVTSYILHLQNPARKFVEATA